MSGKEEGMKLIIEGDFNTKTEQREGKEQGKEGHQTGRNFKGKVVNEEGRKLLNRLEEFEWYNLNVIIEDDEEEMYTYTGQAIIDYVIVNNDVRENKRRLEIEKWVGLDHLPLIITVEIGKKDERKTAIENKQKKEQKSVIGQQSEQKNLDKR